MPSLLMSLLPLYPFPRIFLHVSIHFFLFLFSLPFHLPPSPPLLVSLRSYLLNAVNKGDRDNWITAVRNAIPRSPKLAKKEMKAEEPAQTQRPQKVLRQDTAITAALLDTGDGEEEEETSIDSHLSTSQNNEALQNSHNQQDDEEEEEEAATSFNDDLISQVLGTKENERDDSSDEETATTGGEHNCDDIIANGHSSPTLNGTAASEQTETEETKTDQSNGATKIIQTGPEETKKDQSNGTATSDQTEPQETKEVQPNGIELEAEKKVESSMDIEGKVEVVTSVKVQACGSDQEEEEGEGGRDEEPKRKTSTEVAIAEVKSALTITMIRENTVDIPASDTESDDDSTGDELVVPPAPLESQSNEPTKDEPSDSTDPSPDAFFPEPSIPTTPSITIEKVPTLKRSEVVESDVMSKEEEEEVATPPQAMGDKSRIAPAPFIEKRGFLYKEGGQRKTWKLRYFVLQPGMFSYYKNATATKPLGEVKLKNLQIRYPSASARKQSFQFIIHTESAWNKRNNYVIAAQTNSEMKQWLTAFKLAGQKNITPACTPPGSSDDEATPTT
ncbi:Probable serine/threonine-protein kinase DDB_G0272282 [Geodia barretti]|uniref:Probable serine/threonine-protein kinase DDB_G0272282 n=1 Tax=Geodia barretti TaxID=519541 RepID=A0AA35RPD7_GEOBA|nr:Probable serine/threonine-protein kinase DDB_G0272282 [Geodia barretti]